MSNFDFVRAEWPVIHADCVRAESHLSSDPAAACFYSRRSIEQLVAHLYDVTGLAAPYQDDLAARINDPTFKSKVGVGIAQKLNLIRRVGNTAAHEGRPIQPQTALQVLRELFHVVVFAAFRYSTDPQAVPTGKQFDPALSAKLAPLTRQELVKLAERFKAQDEAHGKALAEKDELAAAKDAEIAALKAQIAAAQAAKAAAGRTDDHDYSEADTRRLFIDVLLAEACWPLDQERDRDTRSPGCRFRQPQPPARARVSSTTSCGVPTGCRWRWSRQSGPPRVPRSASSRPSCTPTAWRRSSVADRIDVPEVVNLVFFKMVRSKSKFWQMIGRGTRLRPDLFGPGEDKKDFFVFDNCSNLEYFSQELPGPEGSLQKSLTQRLFESRLGLVVALDGADAEPDLRESTARWLHEVVAGMNLDNFLVRAHRRQVETWASWDRWCSVSKDDATEILEHLAGLPSAVRDPDEAAKRFDLLVLRRQLAQLEGDAVAAERIRETVQAIAAALLPKKTIPSVAEQLALLDDVAGDEWWVDVTLPMLELMRLRLRGLVRFVERTRQNPVYTDFEDTLDEATPIDLPQATTGMNWERFRAKATAYLKQHEDNVALHKLRRNRQLTPQDLASLTEMLVASGDDQPVDIAWVEERAGALGPFIRSLVGLDRAAAAEAFASYLDETKFSVEQVRFVSLIVDELTANGVMEPARLFESPYTDHGHVDVIFPHDVEDIVDILRDVKAHALPPEVA